MSKEAGMTPTFSLPKLFSGVLAQPQDRRFFLLSQSTLWLALSMHLAFLVFFAVLQIPLLVWLNAGSVILYAACLIFNLKGKTNLMYVISVAEVLIHASIAVRMLGWESGFHYYMITLTPLIFFFPIGHHYFKAALTGILCGLYFSLYLVTKAVVPLHPLPEYIIQVLHFFNATATFVVFSFLSHYFLRSANHVEGQLKRANERLTELAHTDPLTLLLNRRTMMEHLEKQAAHYRATSEPFSILLCDVDNFKEFNDRYGHECGDYVLQAVSELMKSRLRDTDFLARWGGEEFLAMLPGSNLGSAWEIADLLRECVYRHVFLYQGLQLCITITFGVAVYNTPGETISRCISRADIALYQGKQRGKNCVVVATRHTDSMALSPISK
jgi:diguanylate cyclase